MTCSSFAQRFRVRYLAIAFCTVAYGAVCTSAAASQPVNRSFDKKAVGADQLDFTLSIDSVSGLPNDEVTVHINLDNSRPVAAFQILVDYDPTMATVVGADNSGDRTGMFEAFDVELTADGRPGRVRLSGTADLPGGSQVAPLAAGSGTIAHLSLRLASDLNLAGLATAVRFVLVNRPDTLDNSLTDGEGATVLPGAIGFIDGQVLIESLGQLKLGDINLNGLAFEIADAILLTNFIMDPNDNPLNIQQIANSDVNADGFAASVADLVFMVNRLTARLAGQPDAPEDTN